MSVWEQLKEKASEVAGSVSEKIGEFADTAGTEFNILKIKRAMSLIESEIEEIERSMGKRVYELHRHKKIDDKELLARCYEIDGLRKRIYEYEDEIDKIRKEAEQKEKSASGDDGDGSAGSGVEGAKESPADGTPGKGRAGHDGTKDAKDASVTGNGAGHSEGRHAAAATGSSPSEGDESGGEGEAKSPGSDGRG